MQCFATQANKNVLVVGGGFAGIAAARVLSENGVAVTLVEQVRWTLNSNDHQGLQPSQQSQDTELGIAPIIQIHPAPALMDWWLACQVGLKTWAAYDNGHVTTCM